MKNYSYVDHTADIRLKLEAKNLEELLKNGLHSMSCLVKNRFCEKNVIKAFEFKEKIEVSSIDRTCLLIDFLSEVLTRSHLNKAIYCKVEFQKISDNFLRATILGNRVDGFDEDIKAVTYTEANIIENKKGNLETQVIFDI